MRAGPTWAGRAGRGGPAGAGRRWGQAERRGARITKSAVRPLTTRDAAETVVISTVRWGLTGERVAMMMPARTAATAMLVGVLLGLSGCAPRVAGTDGDLVDDWAPMAAAKFDLPTVGMCLDSPSKAPFDPAFARSTPIECDRGHTLEVVLVGTIEGKAAEAPEPPAPGSEGFRAAYAACGQAASGYVGG